MLCFLNDIDCYRVLDFISREGNGFSKVIKAFESIVREDDFCIAFLVSSKGCHISEPGVLLSESNLDVAVFDVIGMEKNSELTLVVVENHILLGIENYGWRKFVKPPESKLERSYSFAATESPV